MIQSVIGYLAYILGSAALINYLVKKYPKKIFNFIPGIVIIYVVTMLLYSLGLWEMNEDITAARKFIQNNFTPAMVFLMCLTCNIKQILKLGPKLLMIFVVGAITVCIGFFVTFVTLGASQPHAPEIFATVNSSYVGASQNFLATANALNMADDAWGNLLLMVNIPYAFWIVLLVVFGNFAEKFNKWTGASTDDIHAISANLGEIGSKQYFDGNNIHIVLALSVVAVWVARTAANILPAIGFIDASVWEYIIVTVLGLILAPTPVGKTKGVDEVANFMVLFTITVSASYTNVLELMNAWVFVLAGFLALVIHGLLMAGCAKIFHWDLHSILTASVANVGGPSSAPVVCGTYHKSYVSIGVLQACVGCIFGTLIGLCMNQVFLMFVR